jgi:ATP-dependent Clp protease adapter protein ClpS
MPKTDTVKKIDSKTGSDVKPEDMYEVILYNDDATEAFYVANCLINVFKHDQTMAMKIMLEAHNNGRAIAEVEGQADAIQHKQLLVSGGLTVEIEKV